MLTFPPKSYSLLIPNIRTSSHPIFQDSSGMSGLSCRRARKGSLRWGFELQVVAHQHMAFADIVRLTAPRCLHKGERNGTRCSRQNARLIRPARSLGGPLNRICRDHIRKNDQTKQRLPVARVPIQMDLLCQDKGTAFH